LEVLHDEKLMKVINRNYWKTFNVHLIWFCRIKKKEDALAMEIEFPDTVRVMKNSDHVNDRLFLFIEKKHGL